jgi:hypothetical protein
MITIYALLENSQIRYIGKTKQNNLEEKLNQHLKEAVERPEQFAWIHKLLLQGRKPEIKPIFSFPDELAEQYEELFLKDYRHYKQINAGIPVLE